MARRYSILFLVVLALAVPAFANHSWGGYHWARTSNPFTLKVGDNVTSQWDGILNTTISDWSQSTVVDLTKVAGQATGRCKGTSGRDEVCNGTYGNTGWLGVASISVTGGTHITLGTVKLNDTYFNTSTYNTTAWRNLVSCQEVGHTLGLDHQDTNFNNANLGTCMDYTNDPSTNQHPNKHDYDELVTIYTHLDSFTTISALLPGGASTLSLPTAPGDDLEAPWQWGTPVAWDGAGRANVFVLDRGEGEQVITRVVWTPDGDRDRDHGDRSR
jgi:hypothetical protein